MPHQQIACARLFHHHQQSSRTFSVTFTTSSLSAVWSLLLQADFEGPPFIFDTASCRSTFLTQPRTGPYDCLCSAINPFALESTSCQQVRNVVTSRLGRRYVGNPANP